MLVVRAEDSISSEMPARAFAYLTVVLCIQISVRAPSGDSPNAHGQRDITTIASVIVATRRPLPSNIRSHQNGRLG